MTESNRKQILLLIILGAVWVVLLGWQVFRSEEPNHVPLKNTTGIATPAQRSKKASSEFHVNLELLAATSGQRETTFTTPRNIFASLTPAGASAGEGSSNPDQESPDLRLPTPAEEKRLAAAAELNQFRYLGFLRVGSHAGQGKNVAVLMKNDDLLLVRAGETIERQVVVRSIDPEGITLQHLRSKLVQVVPAAEEPVTGISQN
ncbi:MAG TPA: hypothetical protein VFB56_06110 [Nitrospiraceae bacterium]|nr:hypothetical protein [Nitrospiraceae bacterium]